MKNLIATNLSTMSLEEQSKLVQGLKDIPIHKMHEQRQYLLNVSLPQAEIKKGIDSEDYRFIKNVIDSLAWSMLTLDRFERMSYQLSNERMLREFFQRKAVYMEQQLTKYTTMEDLLMGESHEAMKAAISKKAETLVSK